MQARCNSAKLSPCRGWISTRAGNAAVSAETDQRTSAAAAASLASIRGRGLRRGGGRQRPDLHRAERRGGEEAGIEPHRRAEPRDADRLTRQDRSEDEGAGSRAAHPAIIETGPLAMTGRVG